VPIKNLFDYLEAGDTLEDFLEGFPPVTREQAVAVLQMAEQLLVKEVGSHLPQTTSRPQIVPNL